MSGAELKRVFPSLKAVNDDMFHWLDRLSRVTPAGHPAKGQLIAALVFAFDICRYSDNAWHALRTCYRCLPLSITSSLSSISVCLNDVVILQ